MNYLRDYDYTKWKRMRALQYIMQLDLTVKRVPYSYEPYWKMCKEVVLYS